MCWRALVLARGVSWSRVPYSFRLGFFMEHGFGFNPVTNTNALNFGND